MYLSNTNLFAKTLDGNFVNFGTTTDILFNQENSILVNLKSYHTVKVKIEGGYFKNTNSSNMTFGIGGSTNFSVVWNKCEDFEKGSGKMTFIFTKSGLPTKTETINLNFLYSFAVKRLTQQEYCKRKQNYLGYLFHASPSLDCNNPDEINEIFRRADPTGCCNFKPIGHCAE